MLTRVRDVSTGVVHFNCPSDVRYTLCARPNGEKINDLFGGTYKSWPTTSERVTCHDCAKVVCKIRNEPYNTLDDAFDDETMVRGIYAAAEPDGRVAERPS